MYNNLSFSSLSTVESKPPVLVKYAGLDISSVAGPTPLVDISTTFNTNNLGVAESATHSITLTGKIYRKAYDETAESTTDNIICNNTKPIPSEEGIKGIIGAIKVLEDHLNNCPVGVFVIECRLSGAEMYRTENAKVAGYAIDKGSNQWTQAADYTINLEYIEGLDPEAPAATEMSDNWSIEPLDDITYEDFRNDVQQMGEWHNPELKPVVPSVDSRIPGGSVNGSTGNGILHIVNIPQFRITRNVSAKGIPVAGTGVSGICFTGTGKSISNITKYQHSAFAGAKEWVDSQLTNSFKGSTWRASGILYFSDNDNIGSLINTNKMFLYNHTRTTNINIYDGRYEVNDTWTALPTGIAYTEEYNIEVSTSEEYTKTVRVAGTIKGMVVNNIDTMQGSGILQDAVVPTGTNSSKFDGKISSITDMKKPESGNITPSPVLDVNFPSKITKLEASKYQNANSGWIYNIKPYLYRRASIGINSAERKQDVLPPAQRKKGPSNNPIYCKESLLYPIPRATTEGHDTKRGVITYSYEYTNSTKLISGVISENISITNDAPVDVFSETQIIGRELGPIMNRSGKTSPKKSVSIEVIVAKPVKISEMWQSNAECPLWTGGYVYNTIDKIVEGVKPFGLADASDNNLWGNEYVANNGSALNPKSRNALRPGIVYVSSDQESWNPTTGRYSRSVSWTYQQCDNKIRHLDH